MLLGMLAAAVRRVEVDRGWRIGSAEPTAVADVTPQTAGAATCPWQEPARSCRRHGCARRGRVGADHQHQCHQRRRRGTPQSASVETSSSMPLLLSEAMARAENRVALVLGNAAYQNMSAQANPLSVTSPDVTWNRRLQSLRERDATLTQDPNDDFSLTLTLPRTLAILNCTNAGRNYSSSVVAMPQSTSR